MKSAKKILLLVLSLMLLVGVFAFTALAEEDTATVVYPDGKTVSVAVGETIVPEAFTDGLYSGMAGTLYKDDATEGWTFTVDGQALTDLTVTEAMAGKKIIAGGFDKVYATVDLTIVDGDYALYIDGKYVQAGAEYTVGEETVTARKIPVGNHKFYLTKAEDVQKFLNTSCSFEINGVTYNHQDIRSREYNTAVLKLYADNTVSTISWSSGDADRPAVTTNNTSGMNYAAKVFLDLNGHTLTNTKTSYVDVRSMHLFVYSSVPGARYDASASTGTMFRTNNDAAIVLGEDNTASTDYSNNIYFLCKAVNEYLYGTGLVIAGGHYYQTAPSENGMVNVSRRTTIYGRDYTIENAKFYLLPGSKAVLNNSSALNNSVKIKDSAFYTSDAAALVYTAAIASNACTVTADGCSFYGVTQDYIAADEVTPATVTCTNSTEGSAIIYNTVTWYDGSTDYYYAASEDEAKAFVETHKKARIASYGKEIDGVMYHSVNPTASFAYDAAFNAVQSVVDNELEKVYFAAEFSNGEAIYFTNAATAGDDFKAYMLSMLPYTQTVTLYQDITTLGFGINGKAGTTGSLDLNGHKLTITTANTDTALDVYHANFFIYSSKEGGVIDASAPARFFRVNDAWYGSDHNYGVVTIGEDNDDSTDYGKNLTIYAKELNYEMYGGSATLLGGTYVQAKDSTASYFLRMGRAGSGTSHIQNVRNITIVLSNPTTSPLYLRSSAERTFTNCTFISANANGGVALSAFTDYAQKTTFTNCNFVNVRPYVGSEFIVYDSPAFGTTGAYAAADVNVSGAVQYLAHGTESKTITVLGETYVLDGALTTADKALKIHWGETGAEYWMIGTKPARDAGTISKREGGLLLTKPAFDLIALNAIDENGVVKAAGEETVSVVFTASEPLAFLYVDTKTGYENFVLVSECGDSVGIGNKFYEIFNAPLSAYYITLYADITISRGMAFGTLSSGTYQSLANGNITLDLNGCTLAVAENFTGAIDPSNADSYSDDLVDAIFCFEAAIKNTFKITSSKAGAKIINPKTNAFIAVGEQDGTNIVIEGDNLEIISKGTIILHVEPASGISVTVNGGKYTYTGEYAAFSASGTVSFTNIELVIANEKAAAVFAAPNYQHATTYTIANVSVYAAGRPALFGFTTHNWLTIIDTPKRSYSVTLNISDSVFAGVNLTKSYGYTTINYTGSLVAATEADLVAAIPSAPAGQVLANLYVDGYKAVTYSANAALVNWGFGAQEYWVIGETATKENATIDGVFTYAFEPILVVEGENNATATIVATAPGSVQMYLVLQSKIGLNVLFAETLSDAIVRIDGAEYVLADLVAEDGFYKLDKAIAPNVANEAILVEIVLGDNTHSIYLSVGKYAKTILGSYAYAEAHNLTYAMVEYVRAMANDSEFLADVAAPEGYEVENLEAREPKNEGVLLESIAFQLDGTVAIAVQGKEVDGVIAANGQTVQLSLSNGRVVTATVVNGKAIFENLYVNEFLEEIQITIADETYYYMLENYFYGLSDASEEVKADVQAFYNYAYHAHVYVKTLD